MVETYPEYCMLKKLQKLTTSFFCVNCKQQLDFAGFFNETHDCIFSDRHISEKGDVASEFQDTLIEHNDSSVVMDDEESKEAYGKEFTRRFEYNATTSTHQPRNDHFKLSKPAKQPNGQKSSEGGKSVKDLKSQFSLKNKGITRNQVTLEGGFTEQVTLPMTIETDKA